MPTYYEPTKTNDYPYGYTYGYTDIYVTDYDYLRCSWSLPRYAVNINTYECDVQFYLYLVPKNSNGNIYSSAQKAFTISANNGQSISGTSGINTVWQSNSSYIGTFIGSFRTTFKYDTSGSKNFTYSFSLDLTGVTFGGKALGKISGSGSGYLPQVPARQATIISAPNFTDEENPTITYSNPLGNSVTSLRACIVMTEPSEPDTDDIKYRDIPKTATSYTFQLTDAERETIRKATLKGSNSRVARFIIEANINGTYYRHKLDKTVTIVNCQPTLSPVIKDVGTVSKTLTNNQDVIIKGYNTIEFNIGAAALKGASIVSQKITCGGFSSTAATGKWGNVESGTFIVTATDNRGNTVSKTVTKTLINYMKPTCNQKVELVIDAVDSSNVKANIEVTGNYFNNTFGSAGVQNDLKVYFRHTDNDGNMGEWINVDSILAETIKAQGSYKVGFSSSDFLQDRAYTFQAKVTDAISSAESDVYTARLIPVFDWGETDFNFNVPEIKLGNTTVIRKGTTNNNLIISTEESAGGIYLRPNGSDNDAGQLRILPDGKISINGATLADFVTQQGTSGIWEYEKWNSGKAVCYATLTEAYQVEDGTTSIYDNIKTAYSIRKANFPFTFTAAPKVFTTANDSGTGVATASNDGSTASYCNVVIWGNGSSLGSINVMAVGKWK